MDNKTLCLRLAEAETENDVIEQLKMAGLWDDPTCWQYFGDNEDNWSTIGNQQDTAQAALVEKLINSVDAMLMAAGREAGIDPANTDVPKDITDALEKFFNIPHGKLSLIDARSRATLAENILLVATGAKSAPCYSIIDRGEGQTPDSMPNTILGLFKSIKKRIPYVQGKFHMGGTGTFRYCGKQSIQVIISKRKPTIAVNEINDTSRDYWGFTVLRREDPRDGKRSSVCTYLAPNEHVLRFKADALPLLPSAYPNKFGSNLEWGTFIKLYEYNMKGLQTNLLFDPYNALSLLLPNVALPIRLYERRKGYSGHTFETTLAGLSVRLDDDKRENLEPGYPSSHTLVCMGQRMTVLVYAFKKGQASNYRKSEGIIFTLNGQTHSHIADHFFIRKSVGMTYLRDDLLIIVDCSNINERLKEDLFMNSRDRVCDCELGALIEKELERLIKDHPGLKLLREKRRREEIEDKLKDAKPLVDIVSKMLKNSPTLAKLFPAGTQLANPFNFESIGEGEAFQGKRYPTYFKLLKKSKGQLVKHCPSNWRFRVQYETDAENDYFQRDNDPGEFILKANGEVVADYVLNLWNGIANLTVSLDTNVSPGANITYTSQVKDATKWEAFEEDFLVVVAKEEDPRKGNGVSRQKEGVTKDGTGRQEPSLLSLPNMEDIHREKWDVHKFDEYSGLEVKDSGEVGYDFYINIDNICLQTELKYAKIHTSPELLIARFRYGMVLIGLAMLREYGTAESQDQTNTNEQPVVEKIRDFTRAISPILLPMISSLSELETDEV